MQPEEDSLGEEADLLVARGLQDRDALVMWLGHLADDDPSQSQLEDAIDAALQRHDAAQASWGRPTDAERLCVAFEQLDAAGIVARHCCETIEAEVAAAKQRGQRVRGCVSYRDEEQLDQGQVALDFGRDPTEPICTMWTLQRDGEQIGCEIVQALTAAGLRASWDGALTSRIFVDLEWQVPRCDGASLLRERLTARNASGAEREAATRGQPQPTRRTSAGEFLVRVAYFGDEGAEPWVRLIELAGTRHPHVSFSEVIVQPQAVSALEGRETVAGRRVVYDIVAFAQRLEILQTAPMLIRSSDAVAFVAADADAMNALVASTDGSVRTKRIAQVLADEPTVVSFDALRALLWSERGSTESEP